MYACICTADGAADESRTPAVLVWIEVMCLLVYITDVALKRVWVQGA